MTAPPDLAWLALLRKPDAALSWSLADWEPVVRMARRQRLLARLAAAFDVAGLTPRLPAQVRRHFLAEQRVSAWRTAAMLWTLDRVAAVLDGSGVPLVLLKGSAYIGQELPVAAGRLPSDVDILVPQPRIAEVQERLQHAGWEELALDDHDRRYYHAWSHEVPPMRHPAHPIELDLHHNILPPVARTHVDARLLLARLQPSKWPAWQVLQPVDQVLHSAAHLFQDSELRDRLRDLVDLDGLLRHFGRDAAFWPALPARAQELTLQEPLALALHFCRRWLGTPVPTEIAHAAAAQGPSALHRAWLLPLLARTLRPAPLDRSAPWWQDAAATALLLRHHRNRMPLPLLLPHLWHKLRPPASADAAAAPDARG